MPAMPTIKCESQELMSMLMLMWCIHLYQSQRESASGSVRQNKDPAKTTHAKLAPVKRGLDAKRAHSHTQNHSQHDE